MDAFLLSLGVILLLLGLSANVAGRLGRSATPFFLSFGLQTSPTDLAPFLPVALALALVTTLTKVATGMYAARRDGVGPRGRVRAGTALVARGEFSIVIAGLAVTAGYTDIGPLASGYVVMLGVLGPVLARFADTLAKPWTREQPAAVGAPSRRGR